jgi:uncharacterized protein
MSTIYARTRARLLRALDWLRDDLSKSGPEFGLKWNFATRRTPAQTNGLIASMLANLSGARVDVEQFHYKQLRKRHGKVFRILTLDGGGIRGIITLILLVDIERRTGKQIWQLFDLISGTSTGGIIALALTLKGPDGKARYTAADVLRLYLQMGPVLFRKHILDELKTYTVGGSKYPDSNIDPVLLDFFGEATLGECLTKVMIPTCDRGEKQMRFYKSWRDKDRTIKVRFIARGTSAAPLYFEPTRIPQPKNDKSVVLDGGLGANNPSDSAFIEALRLMREQGERTPIFVVSLGCGSYLSDVTLEEVRSWRIWDWAQDIPNIFITMQGDMVDYKMQELVAAYNEFVPCPALGKNYYREQAPLPFGIDLDDATEESEQDLVTIGEALLKARESSQAEMSDKLLHLCMQAEAGWPESRLEEEES